MVNNFVIDRVLRGMAIALSADAKNGISEGDVLFVINQIVNPSLTVSSESTDAVDALGTPVATYNRSKTAEFSAENALFDMKLLAAQNGTTVKEHSAGAPIVVPHFQEIEVGNTAVAKKDSTLDRSPSDTKIKVYMLNGDGTLDYELSAVDSEDDLGAKTYIYTPTGPKITYKVDDSNGIPKGSTLIAIYNYETSENAGEGATQVTVSANKFPNACKFVLEVLGNDVCDQGKLLYAYVIFPNAKLSPDFDWGIATDSTHSFSLKAMQKYCDKDRPLFTIVIPDAKSNS